RLLISQVIGDGVGVLVKSDGLFDLNGFNDSIDNLALVGGSTTQGGSTLTLLSSVLCLQIQAGSLTAGNGGSLVLNGKVAGITPFGAPTITSNITLGTNVTFDIPAFSTPPQLIINGVISDGGNGFGITKVGTGTLELGGTASNTFTGTTTVLGGVLTLNKSKNTVTLSGPVVLGNNTDPADTAVLRDLAGVQLSNSKSLTINDSGTYDLNGFADVSGALSGTGKVVLPGDNSQLLSLLNGVDSTFGGSMSGAGGFFKAGNGTLTLTGSNTVFGIGCLDGTLALNNSGTNACMKGDILQVGDIASLGSNPVIKFLAKDQVADTCNLQIDKNGTLDLNGFSEVVNDATVNTGSIALGSAELKLNKLIINDST
ncbi:MAG: autotransporter-associated beta strand repeat-containing protein, partial [Planctomycetota bacterium]